MKRKGATMEAAMTLDVTPATLRADADAYRQEAERLREKVVKLRASAATLEKRACALEERQAALPARVALAGDVVEFLRHQPRPESSTEIAACLGVTVGRIRAALEYAGEQGMVARTGLKRGTRYRIAQEGEVVDMTPPPSERWHERIRDEARRLDTFTFADMRETLPALSESTLARWLRRLTDDGVLTHERVGKAYLYAYVKPVAEAPTTSTAKPRKRVARGAGQTAVAGAGRAKKRGRREVREIVRGAEQQGATARKQKHGYAIVKDGETITSVPLTPSDHRSLKNTRAKLKAAGLE